MPAFSAKLYEILNINYGENDSILIKLIVDFTNTNQSNAHMFLIKFGLINEGHVINTPLPLFKSISTEEVAEYKKLFG